VQAHGPGAKRNFPGEAISEPPVTVGEERKLRGSLRYVGVSWDKRGSSWRAHQSAKRRQHIGHYICLVNATALVTAAAVALRLFLVWRAVSSNNNCPSITQVQARKFHRSGSHGTELQMAGHDDLVEAGHMSRVVAAHMSRLVEAFCEVKDQDCCWSERL
jgi:hypothetical protein